MHVKRKLNVGIIYPGQKQLNNDIDVYLTPLIEDLNELWVTQVEVYFALVNSFK